MRLSVLRKLSRASFDAFRMERNRASPDSRAKTGITLSRKNTRRFGFARSKETNLRSPASVAVGSGSPARLKDNANNFGSLAGLMAGMLFLFARCPNLSQCRRLDRPLE